MCPYNVSMHISGARVERYMECPECKAMSFLGEWNTPKELQNTSSKPCDACKLDIPTRLLVQPKERKKGRSLNLAIIHM